jgi:NAD(P)-dependent dehydrogenase (short-subunit alcohol dehydrogenase family)
MFDPPPPMVLDPAQPAPTSLGFPRPLGDPREIEGGAVFLASDATSYVTGTTLYVDGGHSLK